MPPGFRSVLKISHRSLTLQVRRHIRPVSYALAAELRAATGSASPSGRPGVRHSPEPFKPPPPSSSLEQPLQRPRDVHWRAQPGAFLALRFFPVHCSCGGDRNPQHELRLASYVNRLGGPERPHARHPSRSLGAPIVSDAFSGPLARRDYDPNLSSCDAPHLMLRPDSCSACSPSTAGWQ